MHTYGWGLHLLPRTYRWLLLPLLHRLLWYHIYWNGGGRCLGNLSAQRAINSQPILLLLLRCSKVQWNSRGSTLHMVALTSGFHQTYWPGLLQPLGLCQEAQMLSGPIRRRRRKNTLCTVFHGRQAQTKGANACGGTHTPQFTCFSFALPPISKKLAGDPPFSNFPKAASLVFRS